MTKNSTYNSSIPLQQVLNFFEIDESYPFLMALVLKLVEYKSELTADFLKISTAVPWQELEKIRAELELAGFQNTVTSSFSGNTAAGFIHISPMAAMLLQEVNEQGLKNKYHAICLAIIFYIEKEKPNKSTKQQLCNDTRQSSSYHDVRSHVLRGLPELSNNFSEYCLDLKTVLRELDKNSSHSGSIEKKFIKTLSVLTTLAKFSTVTFRENPENVNLKFDSNTQRNLDFFDNLSPPIIGEIPQSKPVKSPGSISKNSSRYWQQNIGGLHNLSNQMLNDVERNELVVYLKSASTQQNLADSLPVIVIVLSYLTGSSITDILNNRLDSAGFIQRNGTLSIILPKIPIPYRQSVNDEPSTVELSLPNFVMDWFDKYRSEIDRVNSLIDLTNHDETELLKIIKSKLKLLRKTGQFRIKMSKVTASLGTITAILFRDPVLVAIFTGNISTELPMLAYYKPTTAQDVEQAYALVTKKLLGEDSLQSSLSFSKFDVPSDVSSFISGITADVNNNTQKNVVSFHNQYMYYTLSVLMFATGHRPIKDPFCNLTDFRDDFLSVLISDKATDERHQDRFQPIPEIARDQLANYRTHLERLANSLISMSQRECRHLGHQITAMLGKNDCRLPLFFAISDDGQKSHSITHSSIQNHWGKYAVIAANSGRSVVATELSYRGISSEDVELFLGHFSGAYHPWGESSCREPSTDAKKIANAVNAIMSDLGWEVIKSKTAKPSSENKNMTAPKKIENRHSSTRLGPQERKDNRREKLRKAKLALKNVLQKEPGFRSDFLTDKQYLSIKNAFETIKDVNPDLDLDIGMTIFDTWLRRKKVQKFNRMYEQGEMPPYTPETVNRINKRLSVESAFEYYCKQHPIGDELSILFAELIVTASVFGGLSNIKHLRTLPQNIINHAYHTDGHLMINLDGFWWVPDHRSTCLIIYINRCNKEKNIRVDIKKIEKKLRDLILLLDATHNPESEPYQFLSGLAQTVQIDQLPGFLRSTWAENGYFRSYSQSTLHRILSDNYVENKAQSDDIKFQNTPYYLPSINSVDDDYDPNIEYKNLEPIFSEQKHAEARGTNLRNSKKCDRVIETLETVIQSDYQFTPIVQLLLAWGLHLCFFGNIKLELEASSVVTYLRKLTNPLRTVFRTTNPLTCSAEELEELYSSILTLGSSNDKQSRVARLYDFHKFIEHYFAIEAPDWSALFSLAGASSILVEARVNFLTIDEYDRVLDLIRTDKTLPEWLQIRYASAIILGYRFGLRFGEVCRLQLRDLQAWESTCPIIQIRNNIFGDTKSLAATRQVPLIGQLSNVESEILTTLIQQARLWQSEDPQIPFMFDNSPRKLIDLSRMSQYVNSILKFVTGDDSFRFHHLRHSWVNRLIMLATPCRSGSMAAVIRDKIIGRIGGSNAKQLWGSSENRAHRLKSISVACGHKSTTTTISSYFHFADILGEIFINDNKCRISVSSIARLLGRTQDAIYARKKRASNENLFIEYIQQEKLEKNFPSLDKSLICTKLKTTWKNPVTQDLPSQIALFDIDRTLLLLRRRKGERKGISGLLTLSDTAVNDIIDTAINAELTSGYIFYAALLSNQELLLNSKIVLESENFTENKRVSVLTQMVEHRLRSLNDHEFSIVRAGLNVWMTAHDGKKNYLQLLTWEDANNIVKMIELIGCNCNVNVLIPEGAEIQKLSQIELTTKYGYYQPSNNNNQFIYQINLELTGFPVEWKTRSTLNRILMLIWIKLQLKDFQ